MKDLWIAAFGLSGIAAIGSFVFFGLYKNWLHLKAFSSLTRDQRFSLFKLFLVLTFLFVLASLGLGALQMYLNSPKPASQPSTAELTRLLEDRRIACDLYLVVLLKTVSAEYHARLLSFKTGYGTLISSAREALSRGDFVRYHELSKLLVTSIDDLKFLSDFQKMMLKQYCDFQQIEKNPFYVPDWRSGGYACPTPDTDFLK